MAMEQTDSDLRTTLRVLRQRMPLIIGCAILAGGAALAFSLMQEKQYSAESSLLFRDPGFDQRLFGSSSIQAWQDPAREAATNVRLASLDAVADRTAKDLGGGLDGGTVSAMLEVEPEGQSDVVSITATDENPEFAADVANAFARNYIVFRREADQAKVKDAQRVVEAKYEQLDPEEQAGEEGQALQQQISDLTTLEALQTGNAELVQKADVPSSPSSPQPIRNMVIGGVFGLLFGLALALVRERLDRRLKDPDELEESFGLPILGEIPESRSLRHEKRASASEPLPVREAEAFRLVRTRLRYFNVDRELRSLLVTSTAASDGKTTIAFYLARAAASAGNRTLLVEADLHEATLASEFGLSPLPGLAEVLTHQASPESVVQQIPVEDRSNGRGNVRNLDVIVAGAEPPNPLELVESAGMASLLHRLEEAYDLVILDAPPAGAVADTLPLMRLVNGVILVGQLGKTTRDEAVSAREQLSSLEVSPLGIVLNRTRKRRGYAYGYGHGYGAKASPGSRHLGRLRRSRRVQRPRLAAQDTTAVAPGPALADAPGPDAQAGAAPNGAESSIADQGAAPPPRTSEALAVLNRASAEELEAFGLSSPQAIRVLAHRERCGGFDSVDELEAVPGLSPDSVARVRSRLTYS
jgi:capsular exopolysaccharide synthesis family protein